MGGISLYFDTYYLWMFVAINIILIFYKSFTYAYSHSSRALDSIVVVFWALSDVSIIILAKREINAKTHIHCSSIWRSQSLSLWAMFSSSFGKQSYWKWIKFSALWALSSCQWKSSYLQSQS